MKFKKNKWGNLAYYGKRTTIRYVQRYEGFTPDPFTILMSLGNHVVSFHWWHKREGHERPYE